MSNGWKFKKLSFLLLLLTLTLVWMAGCGKDSPAPNQGGETPTPAIPAPVTPPKAEAPPKSTEPITLNLFSASGSNQEWFDRTYGVYLQEKFPHITFNVTFPSAIQIEDYVASNEPLDLIFGAYTTYHRNVLNMNLQTDISDLIKSHNFDLETLDPTIVAMQRQLANGGIYGLPAFIGASGLYYNKDIFDKFAVDYPRDGITWDELYDLSVKLTRKDGDTQYYGFVNDNNAYFQVNQFSLDLVDPNTLKSNVNSEPWKKVVEQFVKFAQIPDFNPAEATVAAFNTKGTVAMAATYTACCGSTPGEAVANWDMIRIPEFKELPGVGPQVYPNFWFMSSISKNRDVAFEVMSFISSPEFQTSLNERGLATALKDSSIHATYASDMPKFAGKNVSVLFPKVRADMSSITEFQLDAAKQLMAAYNKIVNDGVDINTALREAAEETDKIIQAALAAKK